MRKRSPASVRLKMRSREFAKKHGLRIGVYMVGFVVVLTIAAWIFPPLKYYFVDMFRVKEFRFQNVYYNNEKELERTVSPFVGRPYWQIDRDAVKQALEAVPWVAHATLGGLPGSRITVMIEEKQPVAIYRDRNGKLWIVNKNGDRITAFTPDFAYRNFPIIDCRSSDLSYAVHKLEKIRTLFRNTFYTRLSEIVITSEDEKWLCFLRDVPWKIYLDPFGSFQNVEQFLEVEKFIKSRYNNVDYIDLSFRRQIVVKPK